MIFQEKNVQDRSFVQFTFNCLSKDKETEQSKDVAYSQIILSIQSLLFTRFKRRLKCSDVFFRLSRLYRVHFYAATRIDLTVA